jgi:hypothetical protein
VWPVNSPTAALSLNELIARYSLALIDGNLVSTLDCLHVGLMPQFQLLLDEFQSLNAF